ncbi:DUF4030 domain-containing protein [Cytobacillus sp. FJAT-54145]|uniref:DUF4030 domain-containing protein n=1 Tax=Cytobacillus spartinae TaxID=3299023 RepID=A0ABW6K903_9BACI
MKDKLKYPEKINSLHFKEKNKENVLNAVRNEVSEQKGIKTHSFFRRKKIAYSSIAAIALFALFIGASYFSPAMAKVTAKIPYFSLFIKQEEYKYAVDVVITNVINDHKYKVRDLETSVNKREITLEIVGTKREIKQLEDEVIHNINEALVANNFGKFNIAVKKYDGPVQVPYEYTEEDKKNIKDTEELQSKLSKLLEKENYVMAFPMEVRINSIENYIFVAIPKTEKRIDELEELLLTTSKEYGDDFKLDIRRIDMEARAQEERWDKTGVIHIISSGLMQNESFKVTGFSYSFHPLPLQIKIKTSVKASDPEAKELVERIEEEIHEFIQNDEKNKDIRNDPYEVKIYSKDKKRIN